MFAAITYWQLYVFYGGGYCYFIWKMNDLVSVFCICYKSINPLTAISSFLSSSSQTFWLKPGVSRQKPISGPPLGTLIAVCSTCDYIQALMFGFRLTAQPPVTSSVATHGKKVWKPLLEWNLQKATFLPKLTRMMYLCSNNFHAINVYNAKVVFARRQSDQVLLQLKDG